MKTNNCYFCGSGQHTFYAEENGFNLVRCDVCGLLFVENRPSDSEIFQAHKPGIYGGIRSFDMTGRFNPGKVSWYLNILKDLFNGEFGDKKTWLDIGCGHGEFIEAVQTYCNGAIVKGTEPNVRKQESARKRGLDVNYFDIKSHQEKYEVVSMLNVYGHLPDPPAFLKSLKNVLEPHGELILETGDTAGFLARDHHRPFYLPDHISFASEGIVVGLLERLGFEILSVKKYPFMRFNLNSIIKEFAKAILPHYKSRLKYYFQRKKYSQTDMFIRARLKS